MRSGPATQTAFVRGFLLALSPRGGGTTASARQRTNIDRNQQRRAAFAKAVCRVRDLTITNPQPLRRPPAFVPLQVPKSSRAEREEAAMPGQPSFRAGARNSGIPQRLTLMNRQLAAGSAAIIQRDQELSRFRCTHSPSRHRAPATQKTLPLVQNLWTLCLPCGTPRKSKTKFRPRSRQIPSRPISCQAPKSPPFPLTRTIHSRYKSEFLSGCPPPT
jgi:hypothetical protein